jgi:hypothetical protein
MRLKKLGLALVPALSAASLLAISGAGSFAAAGNDHPARHAHTATAAHPHYFGSYRPHYGYYTRHGQYVPGAGDRLIYGPDTSTCPVTGFSMRRAICRAAPVQMNTATCARGGAPSIATIWRTGMRWVAALTRLEDERGSRCANLTSAAQHGKP